MGSYQIAVVCLVAFFVCIRANQNGAPSAACSTLTPSHGSSTPLSGAGGYFIYSSLLDSGGSYSAGMTYTITLQTTNLQPFKGFIIQARDDASQQLIGTFVITDSTNSQLLTCSNSIAATVTHTSNMSKSSVSVDWTAPVGAGIVDFYYSVVLRYSVFYSNLSSLLFRPPSSTPMSTVAPTTSAPTSNTTSAPTSNTTSAPTSNTSATQVTCPTVIINESANSNILTFKSPPACARANCDIYITMANNPMNASFLDIYIEGNAAGWVAVGFSNSTAMENTDVIGCKVDADGMVSVVDTWNPSPNYSPNQVDDNQDGVCTHFANFTAGKIQCQFSRYGPALNPGMDFDLNSDLYVIYGLRTTDNNGASNLLDHTSAPIRTSAVVNPFTATGTLQSAAYPEKALLQVHGILMLISLPVLASIAIFFAQWMKPALPNGEWFQIHRALMIASLCMTLVGFIFAFIALAMNPTPGLINFSTNSQTAHFVIGIMVVLLQIANPIIAIFRCDKDASWRWIFNIFHASVVGVIAIIFALSNVGIGLSLFSEKYSLRTSSASVWTFVGFIGLVIILEIILHVWFTVYAFMGPKEDRYKVLPTTFQWCFKAQNIVKPEEEVEMKEEEEQEQQQEDEDDDDADEENSDKKRKPLSTDVTIRWVAAGTFFVLCFIIFPVIVMVAIG